jgi:hypothetical protein
MFENRINISKYFQELHGEKTSFFSLMLVYFTSVVIASTISYFAIPTDFAIWKRILFFIIIADIAGGAIANFTNSTNQFYQGKRKLRIAFISFHIIHPTLLLMLFPEEQALFIFMGIFTLCGCFTVNFLSDSEIQRLVAIFITLIGMTNLFLIPANINLLRLVPLLFFVKLLIGFSIKHLNKDTNSPYAKMIQGH